MSALIEFLYPAPAKRKVGGILTWWESRRLHYNAIVGSSGLVSLGTFHVLTSIPPNAPDVPFFWAPVLAFGLLANVFYFLGPAAEIAIEKLGGGKILPTGPSLYRMGLTFSVGLTFLPTLLAGVDLAMRILRWLF